MNKHIVFLDKDNQVIDAKLVLSFNIDDQDFVIIDYAKSVFDKNSKYNDLSIFEITDFDNHRIYLSDIEDDDWKKIKDFLQEEIFDNI